MSNIPWSAEGWQTCWSPGTWWAPRPGRVRSGAPPALQPACRPARQVHPSQRGGFFLSLENYLSDIRPNRYWISGWIPNIRPNMYYMYIYMYVLGSFIHRPQNPLLLGKANLYGIRRLWKTKKIQEKKRRFFFEWRKKARCRSKSDIWPDIRFSDWLAILPAEFPANQCPVHLSNTVDPIWHIMISV